MHKADDWTFRVPRHELAELILLKICGGSEPDDGQFAALDDAGWTAIEAIAVRTRTANLLHRHLRASTVAVPQHTALRLTDLYRRQSIYALEQKLVLGRIAALLDDKGIEHVALKGSALAYSLYDQPAMRPLRDLELRRSSIRVSSSHRSADRSKSVLAALYQIATEQPQAI